MKKSDISRRSFHSWYLQEFALKLSSSANQKLPILSVVFEVGCQTDLTESESNIPVMKFFPWGLFC